MTVRNRVTSVAVAVAAMAIAMTVTGRAEGPGFATVGDDLPPLVLGNHKDCCDSVVPEGSAKRLSQLPVPPQYQPIPQRQPAPSEHGPHPAPKPLHPAHKPTTDSPAEHPVAPQRQGESEFSQPADVGSLFSDERAQRLDRLGTLLEELNKRLGQQALPDSSDGAIPPDTSLRPSSDTTGLKPLPSMELPEASGSIEPLPGSLSGPVPAPREPAMLDAEPQDPATPEPVRPEADSRRLDPGEPVGSAPVQPYVADLPPVPPVGPTEPVSVTEPQATKPQNAEPESTREDSVPATMKPVDEGALSWMKQTAIDAPVDRLALADNLYAAGETTTALKVYSEIDPGTLSEDDRHWYEMQLAGCHRRLGDIEEAAKHYRLLVTVEKPAWMADMSRWWLLVLDRRESMTRQSAQLGVIIQQLKEQVHDETRP